MQISCKFPSRDWEIGRLLCKLSLTVRKLKMVAPKLCTKFQIWCQFRRHNVKTCPFLCKSQKWGNWNCHYCNFDGNMQILCKWTSPEICKFSSRVLKKKKSKSKFHGSVTDVNATGVMVMTRCWYANEMQMRCKWDWPAFSCRTYTHRLIQDRCDEIW